jgi:ABC-type phosphate/phosphonate transport system ATPase subunit
MELQIRKLSKTYPNGVEALKDITLTIPCSPAFAYPPQPQLQSWKFST